MEVHDEGRDGVIMAFNPDGTRLWDVRMGYAGVNPTLALAGDGTLHTSLISPSGTEDQCFAIDSAGTIRWDYTGGGVRYSPAAITPDGTSFVGFSSGTLAALSPQGTPIWTIRLGGEANTTPTLLQDGTILVASTDRFLYALASDGTILWKSEASDSITTSPAVADDGSIYFGDSRGAFYALAGSSPLLGGETWARSRRDNRNSASFEQPPLPPAVPAGVTASQAEFTDKVVVSWATVRGASEYQIWRGTTPDPDDATRIDAGISGTLRYEDRAVPHTQATTTLFGRSTAPG